MKYLALLRGINVGGNKKVPMEDLKEYFFAKGFSNVSTILNTGNVVFQSEKQQKVVENEVAELLHENFNFQIPSFIYKEEELIEFLNDNNVNELISTVEKGQKIIFTFAKDLKVSEIEVLKRANELSIVHWNNSMLCLHFSVDRMGTPVIMKLLDSAIKKRGTSRNLNTLKKIITKLETL